MTNPIFKTLYVLIIFAMIGICGGPKWGAVWFGAITFIIWTAYDLICVKIDGLQK